MDSRPRALTLETRDKTVAVQPTIAPTAISNIRRSHEIQRKGEALADRISKAPSKDIAKTDTETCNARVIMTMQDRHRCVQERDHTLQVLLSPYSPCTYLMAVDRPTQSKKRGVSCQSLLCKTRQQFPAPQMTLLAPSQCIHLHDLVTQPVAQRVLRPFMFGSFAVASLPSS